MSDGRIGTRFRDPWEPNLLPRTAGLCVTCRREMWTGLPQHERRGWLVVSTDGTHCDPCLRYIRTTGRDPRDRRGNPAEIIPAERAETDPEWRESVGCSGIDGELFEPDPLPEVQAEVPMEERKATDALRRYLAAFVCGPCPVAAECRQAARTHGYEGIWGGRFFGRNSWVDPLAPGLRGPTIHTKQPKRNEMIARLAQKGYDAGGEPFTSERTA